jgi:threonine/homoserine/homoserine lactone efflux protein
MDDPPVFFVG